MSDAREAQVMDLVEPILSTHGVDVEFVSLRRAGRRTVVVIAVDADGGVMLDDIADYSREISEALDESEVMGEAAYTLEVTSPGVNRPLTLPRHWRRNQGRLVKITRNDGSAVEGRIIDSDEEHVTLAVGTEEQQCAFADFAKAVVQVEFGEGGN